MRDIRRTIADPMQPKTYFCILQVGEVAIDDAGI